VATGASGAADATTEAGSKPRAPLARWKLCHAVVARREMHDTHAARGRRLLQAPRTCHFIIFYRFPIFFCSQIDSFQSGCRGAITEEEDEVDHGEDEPRVVVVVQVLAVVGLAVHGRKNHFSARSKSLLW
jgi:hypothetical protein